MSQTPPAKTVRPRLGAIDPAAIAKAEAALRNLAGNFAQWLNDEIAKLGEAREKAGAQAFDAGSVETLYLRAHDLKGLGTTYGFPLITRIAGSLCRLIDERAKQERPQVALIDAHIDAIRAAVRDDIRTDETSVGRALAEELEQQVSAATT